jgi:hypothetical protein
MAFKTCKKFYFAPTPNPYCMKDNDDEFEISFPWTLAFIISSFCCFGFIGFMKLLNMDFSPFFLWTAIATLLLACISGTLAFLSKKKNYSAEDHK